jgi:hypothetical protein
MSAMPRQPTRVGRQAGGQPTPDRPQAVARRRDAAYRRLAVAIVGLDVPTLADELRAARRTLRSSRLRAAA